MKREVSEQQFREALLWPEVQQYISGFKRSAGNRLPPEDLEACCHVALWKCLAWHDFGRGRKFKHSFYLFLKWAFYDELRRRRPKARLKTVGLFPHAPWSDGGRAEAADEESFVMSKFRLLPDADQKVLRERFFGEGGMSLRELGRANGYSQCSGQRKVNAALKRLRRLCGAA
jgi:hypothetical protein